MKKINVRNLALLVLFALLGALMYVTKLIMQILPNIHLLGLLIAVFTVVFRKKALIPIYLYVFLDGLFSGFALWWLPYTYIWTLLWAAIMLLPKNMPKKIAAPVYCIVTALHGLLFGTLYAPFQAIAFGLDFNGMIAWIIAGLPFDAIHAVSNLIAGTLIIPISTVLKKATEKMQ